MLRLPRVTKLRAATAIVVVLALVAAATRVASTEDPAPYNPNRTSPRLTIGYVGSLTGGSVRDTEVLRGIRVWLHKLNADGGIAFARNRVAAVRLLVYDDRGSSRAAREGAEQLIRRGAGILFAPTNPEALTAVADVAMKKRVLLVAPVPRPVAVPRATAQTFLNGAPVGGMSASLDVLDRIVAPPRARGRGGRERGERTDNRETGRARPRGRIAILTTPGKWARRARVAVQNATERTYVVLLRRTGQRGRATLDALRRWQPDAVLVVAPPSQAKRLYEAGGALRVPWIIAAEDARAALDLHRADRIAVEVPWSPTTLRGGDVFPPRAFTQDYVDTYGDLPTRDAAAGAAMGVVITQMVLGARSTDPTRMLKARDELEEPSFWGRLKFENGQQVPDAPSLLLLDRGRLVPMWPEQRRPNRLRSSVPQRARRPQPATPAPPAPPVAPPERP